MEKGLIHGNNQSALTSYKERQSAPLSLKEVVSAPGQIINVLKRDSETYSELLMHIRLSTYRFLLALGENADTAKSVSELFAEDVIDTRLNWKLADVDMFFRHIRQNQHKDEYRVFGNRITILKLNELAAAYELDRMDALVEIRANESHEPVDDASGPETQNAAREVALKHLNGMAERVAEKRKAALTAKDARANDTNQFHRENQAEAARLKQLCDSGQITPDQMVFEYNNFLIRKRDRHE